MKKTFLRLLLPVITLSGALIIGEASPAPVPGDQSIVKVQCTLSGTVEKENTSCSGNDGRINISSPTGADDFQFSVDGNSWQDSPAFTGLLPGTYEVWMRDKDDAACTQHLGSILISSYLPLDASISSENINCTPNHQGKIDFTTLQGGSGNYEFSVDGGATWQSAASISIEHAGNYTPVLRDAEHPHCEKTFAAVTITAPAILSATASHQDATCYGTSSGTITIHSSGGTNAFQYSIDGGASWQGPGNITYTYSNVAKGSYNVQVRDNAINNCILVLNSNLEVGEPDQLNASVTHTDVIDCYGEAEGTITFSGPSGGSGDYEYSINNRASWHSTPVFNNLPSQNYRVFIRDANVPSCYRELPGVFIDQKQQLSAALSSKVNSCFGLEEGEIEFVSESGGSGNYLYSIDNGATWQTNSLFTGLKADSYQVLLADADYPTCIEEIDNALIITEPNDLDADVEYGDVTCYNTATGYINILNPTGRPSSSNYMFSIDNGNTWSPSRNFTGLTSGPTYTVLIRDAITSTCRKTLSAPITLTQPDQLAASASGTDADCFGASTGTITFSGISGGFGSYEFSVNDGTTWQSAPLFDAVAAGNHALWIRDTDYPACRRQIHPAFAIGQPPKMQAIISNTNVNCFGDATGYIEFTNPSGGSGSYSYSIDGGQQWQTNGQFSDLPAGKYNVMVKDNHCEASLDTALQITQPARLDVQISKQDVLCFGNTDGSITFANPSGGSGTYQYSRDNGQSWQSPNDVGNSRTYPNLAPGTYHLWIRDATTLSCSLKVQDSYPITQPDKLSVTTVLSANSSCSGANDGSIQFSGVLGGSGNYEFSIDAGNTWSDDSVFTNLSPDTYILVVRDAIAPGCRLDVPDVILTEPAPLSAGIDKDTITCFEADNGAIRFINVYGGWGSYEFSVDNGASWAEQTEYTNLPPATYTALVRDKDYPTCMLTIESVSFAEPPRPDAQIDFDTISCFGAANGRIKFTNLPSTTIHYEFSIDNGVTWQSSPEFNNLGQGTYIPQIRHAGNDLCKTILEAIEITEPAELTATASTEPVTCFDGSNGSITIHALNGSGIYQYSIDNGVTWSSFNTFDNLIADTYNLQVRDMANPGCLRSLGATIINQPAQIVLNTSKTDADCYDASTGSVNFTVSGGTGPFEYSVNGSGWTTDTDLNTIPAGTYVILAREINQPACISDPATVVVEEPADIVYTVATEDILCNSESTGKITVETDPADTRSFLFSIDGGSNWQPDGVFENLHAGTYSVLIQDVAVSTCTKTVSVSVYQPAPLNATITSSDITCSGTDNGSIILRDLSGGSGDYEVSIDNGTTWSDDSSFYNLAPGTYTVILKDALAACTTSPESIVIKNADPITAIVTPANTTCYDIADGQIVIIASGGSGNYEYSADNGTTWTSDPAFADLAAQTYQVLIRDMQDHTCLSPLYAATVDQPAAITIAAVTSPASCFGASDGDLAISVSGGTGPFEYSIDNGQTWITDAMIENLSAGSYTVLAREASEISCLSNSTTVDIDQPADIAGNTVVADVTCYGGSDGSITLDLTTVDSRIFEYSIDNGATWSVNNVFDNLTSDTYQVSVRDRDVPTCQRDFSAEVTQPDALTADYTLNHITCNNQNNGSVSFENLSGGTGILYTSIDGNTTSATDLLYSDLAPGVYTLVISDAQGCSVTLGTVTLTEPDALTAGATHTDASCANEADGSITVNATGGSGDYEYSLDGTSWFTETLIENLGADTYQIIVRDANDHNCTITIPDIIINQPDPLTFTTSSDDPDCLGADNGGITVLVSGGTGPFEYSADNGASWSSSNILSGLPAGIYSVLVREGSNTSCTSSAQSVTLTEPQDLSVTADLTHISCHGEYSGVIALTKESTDSRTYEYSIDNGSSWNLSGNFENLGIGTYTILVRDEASPSCNKSFEFDIIRNNTLSATINSVNILCSGRNDGSIRFDTPSGGSGLYEYSVDGSSWQANPEFTGLASGSYTARIRDVNDPLCMETLTTVTIAEPDPISATITGTNIDCANENNGFITISTMGGSGLYEYSVDGSSWTDISPVSGLSGGTYSVVVRDQADNTCLYNAGSVTITSPAPISAILTSTDVNCTGTLRGNIILSEVEGGSGNYEYSFDNQQTWISTQAVSDLDAGTYTVFIRDASAPACIVEIGEAIINDYELHTDGVQIIGASCFGGSDASFEVLNPRGGETANYEFSTNGFTWQTSPVFTDLYANEYNLYIRNSDATHCSKPLGKVEVEETEMLSATVLEDPNYCTDSHTILIEDAAGGSGAYEFSIDGQNWISDLTFSGLSSGNYIVRMRDANATGCSEILNTVNFQKPSVPFAYIVTKPAEGCLDNNNGEVMVLGDGGSRRYSFAISDGESWSEFSPEYDDVTPHTFYSLRSGSYKIKIKGPAPYFCETILEEEAVVDHTDLGYPATITEELAEELQFCITEFSVRFGVQAENALTYQWLVNGTAISNGGIYSGSTGRELVINPFTPDLDGNIYSVVVTGACAPADTSTGKLVVSELITPLVSDAQTTCPEGDLSEIILRGHGQAIIVHWEMKTPEATEWSVVPESAHTDSIYPIHTQGEYLYRAYVQNGACAPVYSPSSSYTMLPAPSASAGDDIELGKGKSVALAASGGILYEWNWDITLSDSSIANPVVNPEYTTTYYVKITNEYGCSKYDSVLVEVVEEYELYIPNTFTPNNDGTNDTWSIRSIELYPDASLEIYNRWGMLLYRQTNGVKPWNGTASGKELPTGTYFYVLKLTPDSESLSGSVSIVR